MPDKEHLDKMNIVYSDQPTSASDKFNIGVRADGMVMLRMFSSLPDDILLENHRTLCTIDQAQALVDTLCGLMDYYPKKSKPSKAKKN